MAKLIFQIGSTDHVRVSLPSKMVTDGDMFVGKAKLRISSVTSSQKIRIHRDDLKKFFAQIAEAYEGLKGEFIFISEYRGFILEGRMTGKGHARIKVWMSGHDTHIPDDSEWQVEAAFTCEPEELKRVLEAKSAI